MTEHCQGNDHEVDHTLEEIAQSQGVTRERIRQIEAKALRKLRSPSNLRLINDFEHGVMNPELWDKMPGCKHIQKLPTSRRNQMGRRQFRDMYRLMMGYPVSETGAEDSSWETDYA